jgi:hypothetical protein
MTWQTDYVCMVHILVIIAVWTLKDLVAELQSVMVSPVPFVKHYSCHRKLQVSITVYGNSGSCRGGGLCSEFYRDTRPDEPTAACLSNVRPLAVGSLCNLRCVGQNFSSDSLQHRYPLISDIKISSSGYCCYVCNKTCPLPPDLFNFSTVFLTRYSHFIYKGEWSFYYREYRALSRIVWIPISQNFVYDFIYNQYKRRTSEASWKRTENL